MGIEHMIDHTMLKADASKDTIIRYCSEAREHKFASVCVKYLLCAAGGGAVKREAV